MQHHHSLTSASCTLCFCFQLIELEKEKRTLESAWDKALEEVEDVDNEKGEVGNNRATNIEGDLKDLEKEIAETKEKIDELKN